jgi:hypothetical protein
MERTTPLTCGCQASVTMRTFLGRSGMASHYVIRAEA